MTRARAIPRVIHQIYLQGELPGLLRDNVDRIKAANPNWDHRLYDYGRAVGFISANYGSDMLAAFDRIDPLYGAARADLLRYLLMYNVGGVYLDIKSYFSGPIDDHIGANDAYVLAQWRNGPGECHEGFGLHRDLAHVPGGEFQNFHVIARPGHPFLKAVIDTVLANIASYRPWHAVGRNGVARVTGPIAYTRAIFPLLGAHPHRRVRHEGEIGLNFSIGGDYDHAQSFRHYSTLDIPVVRLSPPGRWLSRCFVSLRKLKAWSVSA